MAPKKPQLADKDPGVITLTLIVEFEATDADTALESARDLVEAARQHGSPVSAVLSGLPPTVNLL